MIEKVKEQFYNYWVKHLPQGTHTKTAVRKSERFGGGWEIELYELYDDGEVYDSLGTWWCEEVEGNLVFEKMRDYRTHRMSLNFSCGSDFRLYTDRLKVNDKYPIADYRFIEDKVEEYCNTQMIQSIREQLAEKILNGELEINIYCSDLDGYDCPPSKIKDQIIEI